MFSHFFQNKRNGFFVEMGAYDGIWLSNTYFYEKNYNWRGLLIEGGENNCKKLVNNKNERKNSEIVCSLICNTNETVFWQGGTGGSIDHNNIKDPKTKCYKLGTILNSYKVKHIDYFSLDVESAELEVLMTFDFNITVSHWMIETNHLSPTVMKSIEDLLKSHGYYKNEIFISQCDTIFSHVDEKK